MHRLGVVAIRQGHYEVALRHFAHCFGIARKLGDQDAVGIALWALGRATSNMSDPVRAKTYFAESYSLLQESGNKLGQAACLYWFGLLAQFEGDHQQAKIFLE